MPEFSRRRFLKAMGAGAAGLTLSGVMDAASRAAVRPNILFLFTDDQRFDTIHALGNKDIITPTMDSLVRDGTSFTNAYIMGGRSGAVCMPSRAMLLTGRHLFHVVENGRGIPDGHVLLPELLRRHGYETFGTGKWHNGAKAYARSFTRGGKIFFGGMGDHYRVPVQDFDPSGEYPKERVYYDEGVHSSELFTGAAIDFLKNRTGDSPFFMYVSYTAPHDPREMPKEYLNRYEPEKIPLPENFLPRHPFDNGDFDIRDEKLAPWPRTPGEIRKHIAAYYAMITHLDACIVRLLDTLKETGQFENTIIVFAGDNGLAVGQHGLLGKQNLYEHSVHVPLVFSGPGIPKGVRWDAFCYLYDIFPTLCDLLGIPAPGSVDGKSLYPAFDDPGCRGRDSLFFAYKNFQRAVRTDRWKLILYNVRGERHTQLFDLLNDPLETADLSKEASHAGRIRELTVIMEDWFRETGDGVDLSKPDWGVEEIPSWSSNR
ncbi:MAG: sulfatase-like hydrolase/transferase [Candidatus Latescibacteria bacterium]|nr:sulfatase-like hydrolase/transferase [Candidatus Latescibacterota bacterium]